MPDWRLQGQEEYLVGRTLRHQAYEAPRPGWDHDHCEFCSRKFGPFEGALQAGYVTTADEAHWICDGCFEDFKELFRWVVD